MSGPGYIIRGVEAIGIKNPAFPFTGRGKIFEGFGILLYGWMML
jgi:hypothetical protein